jgi:hypothetical protein
VRPQPSSTHRGVPPGRPEREASSQEWWTQFKSSMPSCMPRFVGIESAAREIRAYHPVMVLGLLQTENHAPVPVRDRQASRGDDLRLHIAERATARGAQGGPDTGGRHGVPAAELTGAAWHKSFYSDGAGQNCVEIADLARTPHAAIAVRDYRTREGPAVVVALTSSPPSWPMSATRTACGPGGTPRPPGRSSRSTPCCSSTRGSGSGRTRQRTLRRPVCLAM